MDLINNLPTATAVEIIPVDEADQENLVDLASDDETEAIDGKAVAVDAAPIEIDSLLTAAVAQARDTFLNAVTVDQRNLDEKLAEINLKLQTAACVVLDLEFSGLRRSNFSRPRIFDAGAERYQRLRQVVQQYKPLQVGIAIVQDTSAPTDIAGGGAAHIDIYSCFLSGGDANRILAVCAGSDESDAARAYPSLLFEQSAAEFLISTGFQLEDVFNRGVQYMNTVQEQRLRRILADRHAMFARLHYAGLFYAERYGDGPRELRACLARVRMWLTNKRERMETNRRAVQRNASHNNVSDAFRVGGLLTTAAGDNAASLCNGPNRRDSDWFTKNDNSNVNNINYGNMEDDTYILQHRFSSLPSCLYLHEAVRNEFAQLSTAPIGFDLCRILIYESPDEQRRRNSMDQENAYANACRRKSVNGDAAKLDDLGEWAVTYCLGFTRIFRSLTDTCRRHRIPLVAHNCLADLLYFYNHFHQPLPEQYDVFKADLHTSLFPVVIDTKALYRQYHALLMSTMPAYAVSKDDRANVELREVFLKTMELTTLAFPALTCGSDAVNLRDFKLAPKLAALLAHNAAFDALMTSVAYVRLGRRMWIEAHKTDGNSPRSPMFSPTNSDNGSAFTVLDRIDANWRRPVPLADYPSSLLNIVNRIPLPHAAIDFLQLDGLDPSPTTRFALAIVLYMKRAPLFLLQADDELPHAAVERDNSMLQQFNGDGMETTFAARRQRICETDIITREEYVPLGANRWLVLFTREEDYLRFRLRRRADEIVESRVIRANEDEFQRMKISDPFARLETSDGSTNQAMMKRAMLDSSQSAIRVLELDDWLTTQLPVTMAINGLTGRKAASGKSALSTAKWLVVAASLVAANCFAWQFVVKAMLRGGRN